MPLVEPFGTLGGKPVDRVVLKSASGMSAAVLTYGATLQSLTAPDRANRFEDVVLGYDDVASYAACTNYVGAVAGRFANRIAGGRFELDGVAHTLSRNDGDNTLHGGSNGFNAALWRIAEVSDDRVVLTHESPDGDQGFPGALRVSAVYSLHPSRPELALSLTAETSAPTLASLTTHAYFNLAGAKANQDILDHRLMIESDTFTPVDAALIPTGELAPCRGAFDFTALRPIGDQIRDASDDQIRLGRGYDHNFALRAGRTAEPKLAARLEHEASGRRLDVLTTEPGVQFYSGNFLDGRTAGKGGLFYRQSQGLCLEPQTFPDAPNKPHFPSARLAPGEIYRHDIVLRFSRLP